MIVEGKTIAVSGVGPGLGSEIVAAALRDGANVVLGARNADRLDEVAAALDPGGSRTLARRLDICEADTCVDWFDAAAERFGLSARLDRHVVERTLGWLEAHPDAAAATRLCSINLSAASLVDAGFARFLADRLARTSFPATRLCFELTETGAVRDLGHAVGFMQKFRRLGCRFALDDFGTGFCSFSYLNRIEAELLKIDGSFVREAAESELALAIVKSIVRIAQVTGRRTVAEWVETPELVERMRALGVDYVQGYAVGRPMPIAAFFEPAH
jgi:EAL domain-containing protein (putative c-di-GMP-specific phosphodiesterase class I)